MIWFKMYFTALYTNRDSRRDWQYLHVASEEIRGTSCSHSQRTALISSSLLCFLLISLSPSDFSMASVTKSALDMPFSPYIRQNDILPKAMGPMLDNYLRQLSLSINELDIEIAQMEASLCQKEGEVPTSGKTYYSCSYQAPHPPCSTRDMGRRFPVRSEQEKNWGRRTEDAQLSPWCMRLVSTYCSVNSRPLPRAGH